MTKIILGIVLIVCGLAIGVYLGVWVMLIGGIAQITGQIQAAHAEPVKVGIGIARVVFAGGVGVFSATMLILPGVALIGTGVDE